MSDPASIGLVDSSVRPAQLTEAGRTYLALRDTLRNNPLQAEYELLKLLYYEGFQHPKNVQDFIEKKRLHLFESLNQFSPAPSRHLFLTHPRLLVIAELISGFPGAISRLIRLPEADLMGLDALGETGFTTLCSSSGFPRGLARLCRRIGSDYTRGEERRLHYLVGMALLSIAQTVPFGEIMELSIPLPFANLLTELDIYNLHAQYTSDISIWFDGVNFQVSTTFGAIGKIKVLAPPQLHPVILQPQVDTPSGMGTAPASDQKRRKKRIAKRTQTNIIIDNVLSEQAEDVAEEQILRPQYGTQLTRVGHRAGETLALPDGMVPGADFYVLSNADEPVEFIEIKSITGNPPFDITFTRAECLRALKCAQNNLPYRLILMDVSSLKFYEVSQFASAIASLRLPEVVQFVIRLKPPNS